MIASEDDPIGLRELACRYQQLAQGITDERAVLILHEMAQEFIVRAERADHALSSI
jgi:hypothetical protein